MGGGRTRTNKERAPRVSKLLLDAIRSSTQVGGAVATEPDAAAVPTPPCERDQGVAFRGEGAAREGLGVTIAIGSPPTLVAGGATVGTLSDSRQAAVLTACLKDRYRISGSIVAFDAETREGIAIVVGVKR